MGYGMGYGGIRMGYWVIGFVGLLGYEMGYGMGYGGIRMGYWVLGWWDIADRSWVMKRKSIDFCMENPFLAFLKDSTETSVTYRIRAYSCTGLRKVVELARIRSRTAESGRIRANSCTGLRKVVE